MNNKLYDWDQDHPRIKWLVSALVFLIAMVIGTVSVRGQFGVEQPIFSAGFFNCIRTGCTFPQDNFDGYQVGTDINGQNCGCDWLTNAWIGP